MNVKLQYEVTSCSQDEFTVDAVVAGKPMVVKVPGLTVEMTSDDGSMGHTYRFVPDNMDDAIAEFAIGRSVVVTLAPAKA